MDVNKSGILSTTESEGEYGRVEYGTAHINPCSLVYKNNDYRETSPPPSEEEGDELSPEEYFNEPKLVETSLTERGYDFGAIGGWEQIRQPSKMPLYKLIKFMIDNSINPNVQVEAGSTVFNCHLQVLQSYSKFFSKYDGTTLIRLPPDKVTQPAFVIIYKWMVDETPVLEREDLLDVFVAANFLCVDDLIQHCWYCFDKISYFNEQSACLLYLESLKYDALENIRRLMLARISKFFLPLVSSKDFVEMPEHHVIFLLKANAIYTNSEMELFMVAVRWLRYKWKERLPRMLHIIRCIRFNLMPVWYLMKLGRNVEDQYIKHIVNNEDVMDMITQAISYTTIELFYGSNYVQFMQYLHQIKLTTSHHRQWICDKICHYHHLNGCPSMNVVTYSAFMQYLKNLREQKSDYWHDFQLIDSDLDLACCEYIKGKCTLRKTMIVET